MQQTPLLLYFLLLGLFLANCRSTNTSQLEPIPLKVLNSDALSDAQHYRLSWYTFEADDRLPSLFRAVDQGRPLLLAVDALATPPLDRRYGAKLRAASEGSYDAKIQQLARFLERFEAPVYLRWNEAMEVPVQEKPWQLKFHKLYTEAFQHVAKTIKNEAPGLNVLWSPAGYPGTVEYWPGSAYLDAISLQLGHPQELKADNYPPHPSPQDELRRELHRLRFFEKKILVLGADSIQQADYQTWEQCARRDLQAAAHVPIQQADTIAAASRFRLGVYDPKERLVDLEGVGVEHLFVNWADLERGPFRKDFKAALARGHEVIVTAEPFKDAAAHHDREVFPHILQGQYDEEISSLYNILAKAEQTVYLRFAHEMEIPIKRYPWQSQEPVDYILGYRYFMNFLDTLPRHIKRVWGPAGDRASMDFYPGDDVVDYVSIAIYGLPDKNITDHKKQESFRKIFERKAHRVALANKPLFITEFGVKGPEDFQAFWLEEAAASLRQHRETVAGACYFNLYDNPDVWGEGMPAPDWSVEAATFRSFTERLNGAGE